MPGTPGAPGRGMRCSRCGRRVRPRAPVGEPFASAVRPARTRRIPTSSRLSFGYVDPPELREGVKRLAAAVRAVGRASRQREALPVA